MFSGIREGLRRGSTVCKGEECSAAWPTCRIKNKLNMFLHVYPANTSNERICTSKLDILGLLQGYGGVLRITKVYPSCNYCRCDVAWFSMPASRHDTDAPWEADDVQMDVCALIL